jgi:transcriptional regulator with XRE-family HTH domain
VYIYNHDRWFQNTHGCDTHTGVSRRKPDQKKDVLKRAVLRPLGAQLRRLRLERRLSQEDLAEKASLNYKYIGRLELAKADPGAYVLVRLARGLDVPVGELFGTITPPTAAASKLSIDDAEEIAAALAALTAAVERALSRHPRPLPKRAPRRTRP